MNKKIIVKKAINILLIWLMFFSYVMPVGAIVISNDTSTSNSDQKQITLTDKVISLKDNSKDADFNYEVSVEDSISMIYDTQFNKNDYFINVLNTKINDSNVTVSVTKVTNSKVDYTLNGYGDTYSNGVFSYSKTLSLELTDLNTDTIVEYFRSILGDVKVDVVLSGDDYNVTINGVSQVFKITALQPTSIPAAEIIYQSHVQDIGWQKEVNNGELGGTTGKAKALEAIKIKVNSKLSGSIQYQAHVRDEGWHKNVVDSAMAGTTGKARSIEALRIELTGDLAKYYDIYYRVHIADYGWLGWTKNGEMAGSVGKAKRIEAIYIQLVKKEEPGPTGDLIKGTINNASGVSYQAHVRNVGWQSTVKDGVQSGVIGNSIEALKLKLNEADTDGSIVYKSYVQKEGWQGSVNDFNVSGTTGKARRIEAISVDLTGSMKSRYHIYYRVYVEGLNKWLGWAKDGENAGTVGMGKAIQAIEVRLVKNIDPKNCPTITGEDTFIDAIPQINYNTYVDTLGWQDAVKDGATGGITSKSLGIKGINLDVVSPYYSSGIEYQIKTKNSEWMPVLSRDTIADETIEAIKINLTGDIAKEYNVYYRAYVQGLGWLGWAKNGEKSGTEGYKVPIEALQVQLVHVGNTQPSSSTKGFLTANASISYQAHVSDIGWQDAVKNGATGGTTGKGKKIEALKIKIEDTTLEGSVHYDVNVRKQGWKQTVQDGAIGGTTGKGLKIEAIRIWLTGEITQYYNIYYRVHVQEFGWLGWAKNGKEAGTSGANYRIEAIEIKLVPINEAGPTSTTAAYRTGTWKYESYGQLGNFWTYTDPTGVKANDFKYIDGEKYFFNSLGYLIVRNAKRIIDVSANNGVIDWNSVKNAGKEDEREEVDGVIVRVASWLQKGIDSQLGYNVSEMNRLGIPYGVYLYSYSLDIEEEVNTPTLQLVKAHCGRLDARAIKYAVDHYKMNLSYPIYYDLEKWENAQNASWTWANYKPIIKEFDAEMQSYGGIYADWKIYASPYWAMQTLSGSNVIDRITWIAHYNHFSDVFAMNDTYNMWQYTSSDSIPGILGKVDSSVYGDYDWRKPM